MVVELKKVKAHTIYRTADGEKVPGVTTVLQVLNKPALVKWANNLGLQGIDCNKFRDKMADIGTLAHLVVLDYFKGEQSDYSEYSKDDIDKAENCLISFYSWVKENNVEPLAVETQIISELYRYGGTIDLYCLLNGIPTLVDFKTGKAIYEEMFIQVAAYRQLLEEASRPLKQARILRIGREENEGFEDHKISGLEDYWEIFYHTLRIYNLKNKLKKAGE
jgi:hypothetical protein